MSGKSFTGSIVVFVLVKSFRGKNIMTDHYAPNVGERKSMNNLCRHNECAAMCKICQSEFKGIVYLASYFQKVFPEQNAGTQFLQEYHRMNRPLTADGVIKNGGF